MCRPEAREGSLRVFKDQRASAQINHASNFIEGKDLIPEFSFCLLQKKSLLKVVGEPCGDFFYRSLTLQDPSYSSEILQMIYETTVLEWSSSGLCPIFEKNNAPNSISNMAPENKSENNELIAILFNTRISVAAHVPKVAAALG